MLDGSSVEEHSFGKRIISRRLMMQSAAAGATLLFAQWARNVYNPASIDQAAQLLDSEFIALPDEGLIPQLHPISDVILPLKTSYGYFDVATNEYVDKETAVESDFLLRGTPVGSTAQFQYTQITEADIQNTSFISLKERAQAIANGNHDVNPVKKQIHAMVSRRGLPV